MAMIKGITVTLRVKTKVGEDPFRVPIYEYEDVVVENVLVTPSSTDDIVTTQNMTGKKSIYTLAIPKGDTHIWEDTTVKFFGQEWRTLGFPIEGIEELIPLNWNKKVMVERYG